MNVTTDCGGRGTEDGRRKTEDGRWSQGMPAVLGPLSSVLCLLVLLSGCDKKALEQAKQEAREAKTDVQKLKHSLALAQKEVADIKAELDAVRMSRDELQASVDHAGQERDQALEFARKAQEALAAQSSGQVSATASLQKEVAELNALLVEQQKLIEQLQKEEPAVEPVPAVEPPPAEPNEGL